MMLACYGTGTFIIYYLLLLKQVPSMKKPKGGGYEIIVNH